MQSTLGGIDGCGVPAVWITGIRRQAGSTAQGHQPRSDTLRSTGIKR
jgi:hypothetical protein